MISYIIRLGDPQRPYPTDVEMWVGWPERAKERTKEKEFSFSSLGNLSTSASAMVPGPPYPGPSQIAMQQEMFMRPPQSSGSEIS